MGHNWYAKRTNYAVKNAHCAKQNALLHFPVTKTKNYFLIASVVSIRTYNYSPRWESNPQPQHYECCALPVELRGQYQNT